MAFTRGKLAKVVLYDGTTEHEIAEAQDLQIAFASAEEDITAFGSDWDEILQTSRSCTVTFGGGFDSSDTNGWAKLKDAFLNGEKLIGTNVFNDEDACLRAYINSTNYFHLDGYTTLSLQAGVKGVLKADITFKSTGTVGFA